MKNENSINLFLVDDDAVFLKLLKFELLEHGNFTIDTFPTGEMCLEHLSNKPDLIVLDYHLDGIDKKAMNGIETLDNIMNIDPDVPVIMLSQQDKIEVAINCMHHKAYDYIVKSETAFFHLQKTISSIFNQKKIQKQLDWYMDRM